MLSALHFLLHECFLVTLYLCRFLIHLGANSTVVLSFAFVGLGGTRAGGTGLCAGRGQCALQGTTSQIKFDKVKI